MLTYRVHNNEMIDFIYPQLMLLLWVTLEPVQLERIQASCFHCNYDLTRLYKLVFLHGTLRSQ